MSVFYADLDVKIANNESKLSKELVIYEGDKGLEVYFNLKDYTFCLKPVNILQRMDNLVGAYAQITLINPRGEEIEADYVEITEKNKVLLVITEEMTDQLSEVGEYKMQIHICNDNVDCTSRFSIPPFSFTVKERLKKEQVLSPFTDKEGYILVDKEDCVICLRE